MELNMSRRTFLKTTAAAGAVAAFGMSATPHLVETDQAWAESDDEYEEIWTLCHACITNCPVIAVMRNGRLIKIKGNKCAPINRGSVCVKGLSAPQALYHPNRNRYPMRRVGERGENKWERMSWDEALDYTAKNIYEIYEKYGPEAIFGSAGGGGSPSLSTMHTFTKSLGSPNCFEPGCAQCFMPRQTEGRLFANLDHLSYADDAVSEIMNPNSGQTTLVLWGTSPAYDQTGKGNLKLVDLRARGCKTVVIDPRFTADAAKADLWLPIRAGTDAALAMCFVKYIIEDELYDEEFCKYWTNLPFIINPETKLPIEAQEVFEDFDNPVEGERAFVCWDALTSSVQPLAFMSPDDLTVDPELFKRGITVTLLDGTVLENCATAYTYFEDACKDYTYDKAAEICWLDADKIKTALEWLSEPKAGLTIGVSMEQNPNSHPNTMTPLAIEFMLGHVGGPGNSLSSKVSRSSDRPKMFTESKDARAMIDKNFQYGQALDGGHHGFASWCMCHIPSLLKAIQTGDPYQPRMWGDWSGNKLAMLGDATQWYEARDKLDFVFGEYMYCTSFHIEMADVVFPATEWTETAYYDTRAGQIGKYFMRRPVTHLFEDVDHVILAGELAKRIAALGHEGMAANIEKGLFSVNGYKAYKDAQAVASGKAKSWDEYIEHQQELEYVSPEDTEKAYNTFWTYYGYKKETDGIPLGFGTYSRKCEPYADAMIKMGRNGYPFTNILPDVRGIFGEDFHAVPYYNEPAESPNRDIAKEYPLVMSSGRLPFYHHGTLRNIPYLREIFPTAGLFINTDTAASLGIADRDWVKVSSKRGSIYARAYTTQGINPGEVYQERFWNPEMFDSNNTAYSGGWREMNINVLTKIDEPYNLEWGSYTLRAFQVKVERVDAPPEGIWYKPEDFKPWMPEPSDATEEVF